MSTHPPYLFVLALSEPRRFTDDPKGSASAVPARKGEQSKPPKQGRSCTCEANQQPFPRYYHADTRNSTTTTTSGVNNNKPTKRKAESRNAAMARAYSNRKIARERWAQTTHIHTHAQRTLTPPLSTPLSSNTPGAATRSRARQQQVMARLMTQRSSRSLNSTGGSSVSSGFGGGAYGGAAGAGAGSPARRLSNVNAGTSLPSINSIYWSDTFDFPGPGAYQPDSSTEVLQSTPPCMRPCFNASPNHLLVTVRTSADSQGIATVGIWHGCALKLQQGTLCAVG